MEYMDVRTTANLWNLTERRITTLCRSGRIAGAKKEGKAWMIPITSQKPEDGRKRITPETDTTPKPLPVGISDFKKAVTEYYYVDKTLLIKDFIDSRPQVSLFTRPRRFGKTLTMDMLRVFFEKTDEDTSIYFADKKIWSCGEKYRKHQGKYPVIFLTFKDVKFNTWEESLEKIKEVLKNEFDRHKVILTGSVLSEYDKLYYEKIMLKTATIVELTGALFNLSQMLHAYYQTAPIIIIDEYDTLIQQGYLSGYYEQTVLFMRNLFSAGFKDNPHLSFGFLTGILRVAKESIFSGMNNLKVNSIMENRYSEYFGFTKNEILDMMDYYGKSDKLEEICTWYDGYRFGNTDIFNPWSVLNYIDEDCFPKAFWQSTGDNSIIRQIVAESDNETAENLQRLMRGESISSYIDTSVIYPEIQNNPSTIYSFLLAAGYLKIIHKDLCHDGNSICDVAIPNKEILYVYEKEILSALSQSISQSTAIAVQQAIIRQNVPALQKHLQDFFRESISSFDYAHESFYHGMMLGIYAVMNNLYRVTSNRESGDGRYDIQMSPYNKNMPGILIELKVAKDGISENSIQKELTALCEKALQQIDSKHYSDEMRKNGIKQIMKMGIACYKKQIEIRCEIE